jgi:hypothetical protein
MTVLAQLAADVMRFRGSAAANRLCELCVEKFAVEASALSLVLDGAHAGTVGASGATARRYDELAFTVGEGPCLSAITEGAPVLVSDLAADGAASRWPAYTSAVLELGGVRAVYAIPVMVAGQYVGTLGLFRAAPGPLSGTQGRGAVDAAVLAQLPLLDLFAASDRSRTGELAEVDELEATADADVRDLYALMRVDVSRATGVLVSQLDLEPAQALARLRAHAYTTGRSITEVAREVLDRRLRLEP